MASFHWDRIASNLWQSAEKRRKLRKRVVAHVKAQSTLHLSKQSGITSEKRARQIIVSIATIESRLSNLHLVVASFLSQSLKPDQIIVWVPDTCRGQIPHRLQKLTERGLSIRFCEELGPHKKLVYALEAYPNDILVTADDDTIYAPDWLEQLYLTHIKYPDTVVCHRAHLMQWDEDGELLPYAIWAKGAKKVLGPTHLLLPTGCGGVLYPPGALHTDTTNRELFQKLAPRADDIWFKVMAYLNGFKTRLVSAENGSWIDERLVFGSGQLESLQSENVRLGRNDAQLKAVFNNYKLKHLSETQQSIQLPHTS